MFGIFKKLKKLANSQEWQRGQAMVEYWPTIPVGVMVMISASAIAGPIGHIFQQTSDSLNLVVCGNAPPAYFTLPIGQVVEILGSNYDGKHDRSTFTISVPADSDVILGFDEAAAQRIAQASEQYEDFQQDPTSGKWGIKFKPNGNGGNGSANKSSVFSPPYRPAAAGTSDSREITLTLSGQVDFVDNLEVTIIDGNNNVTSGYIYTTITSTGEDCANQSDKTWGNNGVGNGLDDQPPGNPPVNDGEGTGPGDPGNKGGANKQHGKNK